MLSRLLRPGLVLTTLALLLAAAPPATDPRPASSPVGGPSPAASADPGAPAEPFGLGVTRLKVKLSTKSETKNKLFLFADFNLPEGSVDPEADTLSILVGGLLDHVWEASELKKTGKDTYSFKDKLTSRKGVIQLFRKGSSRGRLKMKDKGFLAAGIGGIGDLEALPVRLVWGDMDLTVVLAPDVNKKLTRANFKERKDGYDQPLVWLERAQLLKKAGVTGADKLKVQAKLSGGTADGFDPLSDDTTVSFGPFSVVVPADEWTVKGGGTRLSWQSADGTVRVRHDLDRERLELDAKDQDLAAATTAARLEVSAGAFSQALDVVLASNGSGSKLSY